MMVLQLIKNNFWSTAKKFAQGPRVKKSNSGKGALTRLSDSKILPVTMIMLILLAACDRSGRAAKPEAPDKNGSKRQAQDIAVTDNKVDSKEGRFGKFFWDSYTDEEKKVMNKVFAIAYNAILFHDKALLDRIAGEDIELYFCKDVEQARASFIKKNQLKLDQSEVDSIEHDAITLTFSDGAKDRRHIIFMQDEYFKDTRKFLQAFVALRHELGHIDLWARDDLPSPRAEEEIKVIKESLPCFEDAFNLAVKRGSSVEAQILRILINMEKDMKKQWEEQK